jgi:phosphoglycolate phosphatase
MTQDHDLLLFDMDGTLSDPLVGIGRSLNHALTHFGYAPLELPEVSAYVGIPLDETFQALTGITAPFRLNALVAKYRERYAEVGYAENVLYPGIAEALARLAAADVALAVCTSKRKCFAERILEKFGIRSYFRFVSGGDTGVRKWQQVEELLAKGWISESSVMVGDRAADLIAAHRNRLTAAGVLWGFGSREELERESPRYWLGTPSEIPMLAEGWHRVVPARIGRSDSDYWPANHRLTSHPPVIRYFPEPL